jgi:hypothetical protein
MVSPSNVQTNSISVGREITGKQPYKREGANDPTVRTILAYSGAQVSPTKERYARQQHGGDGKCD